MRSATGARLTAWVEGRVQGVGFRWWARSRALELGLTGFAENLADGRVKVVAEGRREGCEDLLALLAGGGAGQAGPGDKGGAPVGGADGRPVRLHGTVTTAGAPDSLPAACCRPLLSVTAGSSQASHRQCDLHDRQT